MPRRRNTEAAYTLYRRANGIYSVAWTENGRTSRRSTGSREKIEAAAWLARFAAERRKPLDRGPGPVTVDEILDGYLADRRPVVAAYDTLVHSAKPIRRAFGSMYVEQLSDAEARRYARERRLARRKNGTILREIQTLRAALNWGARTPRPGGARGECLVDRVPYLSAPAPARGRPRWLTVGEAARLLRACPSLHLRLFVRVALYTGARTGAILDLTWDRVDMARGTISFALPGRDHGNKRRAVVPIPRKLLPVLRRYQRWAKSEHVIEYGGVPIERVRKAFDRAAARAGIVPRVTPHDLRRTAATWMVISRVPLAEVARYLGDTEETVRRVYGHHSPEYLSTAKAALDGRERVA